MRMMLSLVFVSLATACTTDHGSVVLSASTIDINPATDLTEPAFVNDRLCQMVFPGALTPETEMYQIWAVGTHGIVNAPYNTLGRPNLYAVFGTNAASSVTHHVDGFSQFDHYHVLDNLGIGDEVQNTTWDLLALFPGPNYNAATYQPARSVVEMLLQSTIGVLSPVMTLPEAGFPPVVLYSPIVCP